MIKFGTSSSLELFLIIIRLNAINGNKIVFQYDDHDIERLEYLMHFSKLFRL